MKTRSLVLALLISAWAPLAAQAGARPVLTFTVEEALRLPKGRTAIHAPVRLKADDSLHFTVLQTADLPAREPRAPDQHLRNNPNSYGVHLEDLIITSASAAGAGGGGGAGKVSMNDFHFASVPEQYRFGDGACAFSF